MSAAKHTPGPWEIAPKRCVYRAVPADYETTLRMAQAGVPFEFEALSVGTNAGTVALIPLDESSEDNALVVRAAPDLLAEIEREYAELADVRNNWPGRNTTLGQAKLCRLRDLICLATGRDAENVQDDYGTRAAISKATGEPS